MYPFDLLLFFSRVSIVIAHIRDRALLIHIGSSPRERPRPLYGEDPLGFKTPFWVAPSRPPLGEEPVTLCIILCWLWILYLTFVFIDLAHVWSILVGWVILSCFPSCFPSCSSCSSSGSAPFVKDRPARVLPYIILVSWATLITISEPPLFVF